MKEIFALLYSHMRSTFGTAYFVLKGVPCSYKIIMFGSMLLSTGTLVEIGFALTLGAFLFLLIGSAFLTVGLKKYVDAINEKAREKENKA